MQIKSILAVAAIALAATVGSASAADQFATLGGVSAESLSSVEMAAVVGADLRLRVNGSTVTILATDTPFDGLMSAQSATDGVLDVALGPPFCPPDCQR